MTSPDSLPDIDLVTKAFGLTRAELAEVIGLPPEALQTGEPDAPAVRSRVVELIEIISRIEGWAGGGAAAMRWYRAQPIPAFGGRTAELMVQAGEAEEVRRYLNHIAAGGFA